MTVTYYDLLRVSRVAPKDDIKKAYRRACLRHHPDKGGDEEMFKQITIAWQTLGNEDARRIYDRSLLKHVRACIRQRPTTWRTTKVTKVTRTPEVKTAQTRVTARSEVTKSSVKIRIGISWGWGAFRLLNMAKRKVSKKKTAPQ